MMVVIIDYGSGNLRSAAKAFERSAAEADLNISVRVTAEPKDLDGASHIVLPGVGAFEDCMNGLRSVDGMRDALVRNVLDRGKAFLGICVGMQLMAERGLEHGVHNGLGWVAGQVEHLRPADPTFKIPHMGWNELRIAAVDHPVLENISDGAHAYFVHGYALYPDKPEVVLATVDYGSEFPAIVGRDNIVGTQFHPEKSQITGLTLIRNFLTWRP